MLPSISCFVGIIGYQNLLSIHADVMAKHDGFFGCRLKQNLLVSQSIKTKLKIPEVAFFSYHLGILYT